ncbi:hypothetical protein [Kribbella catacumbae]|uniref:hypothetical protein n=1 Tax=Kribbella catacumbae TaxID=460086 RepID=UPI00037D89CF|nr:hypothetical protein [Kribbella catacumbae]
MADAADRGAVHGQQDELDLGVQGDQRLVLAVDRVQLGLLRGRQRDDGRVGPVSGPQFDALHQLHPVGHEPDGSNRA